MLEKMGWKGEGTGLGVAEQGIATPVEAALENGTSEAPSHARLRTLSEEP